MEVRAICLSQSMHVTDKETQQKQVLMQQCCQSKVCQVLAWCDLHACHWQAPVTVSWPSQSGP